MELCSRRLFRKCYAKGGGGVKNSNISIDIIFLHVLWILFKLLYRKWFYIIREIYLWRCFITCTTDVFVLLISALFGFKVYLRLYMYKKTSVFDFNVEQIFSPSNFQILCVVVNVNHVQNCFYVIFFYFFRLDI